MVLLVVLIEELIAVVVVWIVREDENVRKCNAGWHRTRIVYGEESRLWESDCGICLCTSLRATGSLVSGTYTIALHQLFTFWEEHLGGRSSSDACGKTRNPIKKRYQNLSCKHLLARSSLRRTSWYTPGIEGYLFGCFYESHLKNASSCLAWDNGFSVTTEYLSLFTIW